MEKSQDRIRILEKISEYESLGKFDIDVEDDPITIELLPNKVDYLNKRISSKIKTAIANRAGAKFFENMIKNNRLIIEQVIGLENFLSVDGGAIITCNHFNVYDNYVVYKSIQKFMNNRPLYKVIREGNYTNPPKGFGLFMRHCNTLPLSSNVNTMKKFLYSIDVLLRRGEKVLVYPEQAMWWNYRKPRPYKNGAFKFAYNSNVPIIPMFITMQDSDIVGEDGFFVQKLFVHIMPPIYSDKTLSKNENIEMMKNKNFQLCKKVYENFYGEKLNEVAK